MSDLPDLDRPDTFVWGLTAVQFGQCLAAGFVLSVMGGAVAFQMAVLRFRNPLVLVLEALVGLAYASVALTIIKHRQNGLPATQWLHLAWKWWRFPKYWVNAPEGLDFPHKLRHVLDSWRLGVLDLPWSGYTPEGDVILEDGSRRRTVAVPGLDLARRSEGEREQLAGMWRKVVDSLDSPIMVLARVETTDLSARVQQLHCVGQGSGLGSLAEAYAEQLGSYHGRLQRPIFLVLRGKDVRELDAAEDDIRADLAPMGLRVHRVRGNDRPWQVDADDYLLPIPTAVEERPSYLEVT